jgi:hypothetical protein
VAARFEFAQVFHERTGLPFRSDLLRFAQEVSTPRQASAFMDVAELPSQCASLTAHCESLFAQCEGLIAPRHNFLVKCRGAFKLSFFRAIKLSHH